MCESMELVLWPETGSMTDILEELKVETLQKRNIDMRLIFLCKILHCANMSMQYTAMFYGCKNFNFQMKNVIFFFFLLKT